MKKLEKLDKKLFEAKALNNSQQNIIVGGTQIKTGETGGTDCGSPSVTGFPIYTDNDLPFDPDIIR